MSITFTITAEAPVPAKDEDPNGPITQVRFFLHLTQHSAYFSSTSNRLKSSFISLSYQVHIFLLEYAALRPRETSAAATAAVSAAVAAAAAASTSQQGLTESLTALQAGMSEIKSMRVRKSSQDSGAVIPSDDEDGTGNPRSSSHASGHSSHSHHRVDHKILTSNAQQVPSTAAAAVATWRAFNRPRMALAVLAVSLQHIAAHSDHLQYHQHRRQQEIINAKLNGEVILPAEEDEPKQPEEVEQQVEIPSPPLPVIPAVDDIPTSSLDEGIEPDR